MKKAVLKQSKYDTALRKMIFMSTLNYIIQVVLKETIMKDRITITLLKSGEYVYNLKT